MRSPLPLPPLVRFCLLRCLCVALRRRRFSMSSRSSSPEDLLRLLRTLRVFLSDFRPSRPLLSLRVSKTILSMRSDTRLYSASNVFRVSTLLSVFVTISFLPQLSWVASVLSPVSVSFLVTVGPLMLFCVVLPRKGSTVRKQVNFMFLPQCGCPGHLGSFRVCLGGVSSWLALVVVPLLASRAVADQRLHFATSCHQSQNTWTNPIFSSIKTSYCPFISISKTGAINPSLSNSFPMCKSKTIDYNPSVVQT